MQLLRNVQDFLRFSELAHLAKNVRYTVDPCLRLHNRMRKYRVMFIGPSRLEEKMLESWGPHSASVPCSAESIFLLVQENENKALEELISRYMM